MTQRPHDRWNRYGALLEQANPALFYALLHLADILSTTSLNQACVDESDDDAHDREPDTRVRAAAEGGSHRGDRTGEISPVRNSDSEAT